jgi:hypothetical protein
MGKVCLDCGEPLVGRADKKFCSDLCRNSYNNKLNSDNSALERKINNALRKNRRILSELNVAGKTTVHKDKLINMGFNFTFITHLYITQKGHTYKFIYEQGYLPLENDFYMLVQREIK